MANNKKVVQFDFYCKKCLYKNRTETKDPCNECLTISARENSHIPIKYKPKG